MSPPRIVRREQLFLTAGEVERLAGAIDATTRRWSIPRRTWGVAGASCPVWSGRTWTSSAS